MNIPRRIPVSQRPWEHKRPRFAQPRSGTLAAKLRECAADDLPAAHLPIPQAAPAAFSSSRGLMAAASRRLTAMPRRNEGAHSVRACGRRGRGADLHGCQLDACAANGPIAYRQAFEASTRSVQAASAGCASMPVCSVHP